MLRLIGKKIGMTQVFKENGMVLPVTVVEFQSSYVLGKKTIEKDGYSALVAGAYDLKVNKITKPVKGQFKALSGIKPKKYIFELKNINGYEVGSKIGLDIFNEVRSVDVTGVTKGKGFQGAMKRHNFSGGPATHGSKFHRALGGTGQATYPARTFKGTKMAGRMGGIQQTTKNLEVVQIDLQSNVLLIKGPVPGARGSFVMVRPS